MQAHRGPHGFTLIELLIVIALSAGLTAAGYAVYRAQQRSFLKQQQLTELQQSARVFLYYLERDVRMAGLDPTKAAGAGFLVARPADMAFTADMGRPRSGSGCSGIACDSMPDGSIISEPCTGLACVTETFRYGLDDDGDGDGIAGAGSNPPVSTTSVVKTFNAAEPSALTSGSVIDHVEALEFLYKLSDGTATTTVSSASLASIRAVTVSLLLRSGSSLAGHSTTATYYPASNSDHRASGAVWGPFSDSYLRLCIITDIPCINMPLLTQN